MPRVEFSKKTKLQAFQRSGGRCERCTSLLYPGKFDYDHIVPSEFSGDNSLENCKVLCAACHSTKTARQDIPAIAKSTRVRNKHIGAKAKNGPAIPGSKRSGWKRKMDGTVVKR